METIMEIFIAILGGLVGGLVAWLAGYFLGIQQKRRDICIQYLIDAWRLLEQASNRKDNKFKKNIEVAVADIQLLGSTKEQIDIAQRFAEKFDNNETPDALELLIALRKALRKKLRLKQVPDVFRFVRMQ
jgi:hypothetical protein